MTDTLIDAIRVHIAGSDVPLTPPATAKPGTSATFRTVKVADLAVDGVPRMLLAQAPSRTRATIIVTGDAADTVCLAGSSGDAQSLGASAVVLPTGITFAIETMDEVWVGVGSGNSPVVSVIAEYRQG